MNIIKTAIFFALLLIQNTLSAQTFVCDSVHWAKPGTYEIVTIPGTVEGPSGLNVSIPNNTLCEIEAMRKENKTVEYKLNYCTLIRIYPKIHQTKTTIGK